MTDADGPLAVDDDALLPGAVPVEEHAIDAAPVVADEPSGFVAKDDHMIDRDIGIVEHDVVVIAAADTHDRPLAAKAGRHVAVSGQDFHPDHLVDRTASRKRLLSATASS